MACPEGFILCGKDTVSRGLCVTRAEECSERSDTPRQVPVTERNVKGEKFSYLEKDLGKHCYFSNLENNLDYSETFVQAEAGAGAGAGADAVPSRFSCLTYNIWGLARTPELQKLFSLRKPLLEEAIRESGADLLFLQEMSSYSHHQLSDLIGEYKFSSRPLPADCKTRSVDTYCLSKYKPSAIHSYGLPGVLGYSNSLLVVEFKNLVVFNLYNQAGSKSSPGQEKKWIHYSRCRYDILETIFDLIRAKYHGMPVILCGDFNFHLDGSVNDWPEMDMIERFKSYGFIDTFRNVSGEPGFTEDTDLNLMRWNHKLIEKHYRYDGILYRPSAPLGTLGSWKIESSGLIGLGYKCLNKEDSQWFIKNISEAGANTKDKLAVCSEGGIPINASDHFGVLTTFSLPASNSNSPKSGRKTRRRIRNRKWKTRSMRRNKIEYLLRHTIESQ